MKATGLQLSRVDVNKLGRTAYKGWSQSLGLRRGHINYYIKDVPVVKDYSMKTFRELRYRSALDGGEWSVSRPGRVIPEERATNIPFDRRVGRENCYPIQLQ
jgi:hypothetical protein